MAARLKARSGTRNLPGALLRAREAVMERMRPILRANDLTEQQWRVLRVLAAGGETEVTHLARAATLKAPSVSRILRDLVARDLIGRRTGEADQRVALVSITPAGLDLIKAVAPHAAGVGAEIAALFGVQRVEQLVGLLLELEAVLAEAPGGD